MKFLRVIFLLLLIALVWSGKREGAIVSRLQTEHETLVARATAIGLPEKESDDAKAVARTSGRRSTSKPAPEQLKDELVAAFLRLKALESQTDPDSRLKVEKEVREWIGRLMDLSPKELKQVIEGLLDGGVLEPEDRRTLLAVVLSLASSRQSETAAELYLKHREMVGDGGGIFDSWGGSDPASALAWLEKNRESLGKDHQRNLQRTIQAAAARDPALALAALSNIEDAKDRTATERRLAMSLSDDGARAALLAELRTSGLGEEDRTEILRGLGSGQGGRLSQAPGAWMQALSPAEAVTVTEGISKSMTSSTHPEAWFDWMGKSLPPEQVADTTKPLLTKWISDDYAAAGEWINRQPPGEFRNAAAANYARTMANRFPDTAKDWANTLPEGPEKRRLLEEIK